MKIVFVCLTHCDRPVWVTFHGSPPWVQREPFSASKVAQAHFISDTALPRGRGSLAKALAHDGVEEGWRAGLGQERHVEGVLAAPPFPPPPTPSPPNKGPHTRRRVRARLASRGGPSGRSGREALAAVCSGAESLATGPDLAGPAGRPAPARPMTPRHGGPAGPAGSASPARLIAQSPPPAVRTRCGSECRPGP